jgi:long-subunit acyl-CoA synthetase (AMP-forming)
LRTIVCLDGGDETTLSWQEPIECEPQEFSLGEAAAAVRPEDLLMVISTVGTDGSPTLVRLIHPDVLARVVALRERLALGDGWRAISWQPMAGMAERLCTQYLPLAHG